MATSKEYIEFVCEQIYRYGTVTYRKMFGEYMAYLNEKPILLVCDNTVYIKEFPELDGIMSEAERGIPYDGAKERYILRRKRTGEQNERIHSTHAHRRRC